MSDFSICGYPVGRKDYRCEWCGQTIPKGEKHFKFTGVWEGDFQDWRMHQECEHARCSEVEYGEGFTPFENERPEKEFSLSEENTPVDHTYKADTPSDTAPNTK